MRCGKVVKDQFTSVFFASVVTPITTTKLRHAKLFVSLVGPLASPVEACGAVIGPI